MFLAYAAAHEPVGSILVYLEPGQRHGVLDDVMVLAHWRGQNIAKPLTGRGLEYLRDMGLPVARLEVLADNRPAIAAYQAMGFRTFGRVVMLGMHV